jgi:2-C-methyl-D-erythritol 4-phosphate cytidylyltransferase
LTFADSLVENITRSATLFRTFFSSVLDIKYQHSGNQPMKKTIDCIIVAAGSGTRLGFPIPKAFVPLASRPLLSYSLDVFLSHSLISTIFLVVPESMREETSKMFQNPRIRIVIGGEQRWQSVQNGINNSDADLVLVHDAARPFVTIKVIDAIIQKFDTYQCVITATPVVDTIRTFRGDCAGVTVDREKLIRVGTPQLFDRKQLCDAFNSIKSGDPAPTDEAILIQNAGIDVGIAWGDPNNFKITTAEDLQIAEAMIANNMV